MAKKHIIHKRSKTRGFNMVRAFCGNTVSIYNLVLSIDKVTCQSCINRYKEMIKMNRDTQN